jgi:hypothetical protein
MPSPFERARPPASPRTFARPPAFLFALALAGCGLLESFVERPPPWTEVRGERSRTPPAQALRRVLVLPFAALDAVPAQAETLRVAFSQALRDACGFDVIAPDVASLPRTTRDELLAGSAGDVGALVRLHREWDADAILYGRVAFSRPYGEPGLGLELELVDARDGARLWVAKDVVDARQPDVRASLLEFRRLEGAGDPTDATQLPFETFARFVAFSFVRTLFAPSPAPPTAPPGTVAAAPKNATSVPEVPGKRFPASNER